MCCATCEISDSVEMEQEYDILYIQASVMQIRRDLFREKLSTMALTMEC